MFRRVFVVRPSLLLVSLVAMCLGVAPAAAQEELDDNRRIEKYRDVTQTMSEPIYRRLTSVHDHLADDEYAEALAALDRFGRTVLNDYEEALVLQTYGFAYIQQGRHAQAVEYFEKSLAMESLPGEAQQGMLYSLASLYAAEENHQRAIDTMRRWFRYEEDPIPDAYMVIATSFVEMQRYTDALPYVRKAIQKSDEPKEAWYMLELAIHFEKQDYRAAVALLRKMVQFWPDSGKYWDMLASAYLELKQDKDALDTLMVAYTNGLIDDSTRIMTVVQLNMVLDIPYTAGVILDGEMRNGRIEVDKKNLDILLQAWLSSREYKRAMDTLERLSPYVDDGSYLMRKAGIHNELGEWALVTSTVAEALERGVDNEANAHMLAGMAYTELKQFDNALASFRRCRDAGDDKQRQNATAWISFVQDKIAVARAVN